jgi:hypothetical protein
MSEVLHVDRRVFLAGLGIPSSGTVVDGMLEYR